MAAAVPLYARKMFQTLPSDGFHVEGLLGVNLPGQSVCSHTCLSIMLTELTGLKSEVVPSTCILSTGWQGGTTLVVTRTLIVWKLMQKCNYSSLDVLPQ